MTTCATVTIFLSSGLVGLDLKFAPAVIRAEKILLAATHCVQGSFGINMHAANRVFFLALG